MVRAAAAGVTASTMLPWVAPEVLRTPELVTGKVRFVRAVCLVGLLYEAEPGSGGAVGAAGRPPLGPTAHPPPRLTPSCLLVCPPVSPSTTGRRLQFWGVHVGAVGPEAAVRGRGPASADGGSPAGCVWERASPALCVCVCVSQCSLLLAKGLPVVLTHLPSRPPPLTAGQVVRPPLPGTEGEPAAEPPGATRAAAAAMVAAAAWRLLPCILSKLLTCGPCLPPHCAVVTPAGPGWQQLLERCWAEDPEERPDFG